jgi:DNA helicase-2/ATP-dependent DNA helicase PcrA
MMIPGSGPGLDPEQQQAVMLDAPAVCVLAGAGSGKTRVLTRRVSRRIEDGSAEAAHTLVLTFTRKAADELRERLRGTTTDDVTAGTFHSVAFAQLRHRYAEQGKSMPALSTQPARILEPVLERLRMDRVLNVRPLVAEIAWAKSRRLTPETYADGAERYRHKPPASVAQMVRIYEAYEWEKRKRHVLDYDDLLSHLTNALHTDRVFANAQRWRFRHFYVDEFQDLNRAQFDLLQAWIGPDRTGRDIFLVGDANQAIYGWNGADSSILKQIDTHYPDVQIIRLQTNYRSTTHVLAAAHAVLQADQLQEEGGEVGVAPVVREFADEHAEGEGIARAARAIHGTNRRWGDIAVLVRTNAQRAPLQSAFEKFRIPFRSTGGAAWLSTPEVRTAIDELRETATARLTTRAPDVEEMARVADGSAAEYLAELSAAVRRCLQESPTITVSEFLAWMDVTYRFDGPTAGSGAVTITTFHRAKGLEWPVVFLAGLEDGLVPLGNDDEEERRLFYVAITRAREELHCSWARQRSGSRGVTQREPSPWLEPLQHASQNVDEAVVPPTAARTMIQTGRSTLIREPAQLAVDPSRDAIERWRAARSKLTGLPKHQILGDEVVDAIIDLRPRSVDQLAAIEGLGRVRAAAIGDQLLACLGE